MTANGHSSPSLLLSRTRSLPADENFALKDLRVIPKGGPSSSSFEDIASIVVSLSTDGNRRTTRRTTLPNIFVFFSMEDANSAGHCTHING